MQEREETKTTKEQVETIRKEEVVDVYGNLLQKLWNKIVVTLGIVTLKAIMRRSLIMTAQKYDFLSQLEITDEGLDLATFRARVSEQDRENMKSGFEELILNLFAVLAELTGEVIVNKLFREEAISLQP